MNPRTIRSKIAMMLLVLLVVGLVSSPMLHAQSSRSQVNDCASAGKVEKLEGGGFRFPIRHAADCVIDGVTTELGGYVKGPYKNVMWAGKHIYKFFERIANTIEHGLSSFEDLNSSDYSARVDEMHRGNADQSLTALQQIVLRQSEIKDRVGAELKEYRNIFREGKQAIDNLEYYGKGAADWWRDQTRDLLGSDPGASVAPDLSDEPYSTDLDYVWQPPGMFPDPNEGIIYPPSQDEPIGADPWSGYDQTCDVDERCGLPTDDPLAVPDHSWNDEPLDGGTDHNEGSGYEESEVPAEDLEAYGVEPDLDYDLEEITDTDYDLEEIPDSDYELEEIPDSDYDLEEIPYVDANGIDFDGLTQSDEELQDPYDYENNNGESEWIELEPEDDSNFPEQFSGHASVVLEQYANNAPVIHGNLKDSTGSSLSPESDSSLGWGRVDCWSAKVDLTRSITDHEELLVELGYDDSLEEAKTKISNYRERLPPEVRAMATGDLPTLGSTYDSMRDMVEILDGQDRLGPEFGQLTESYEQFVDDSAVEVAELEQLTSQPQNFAGVCDNTPVVGQVVSGSSGGNPCDSNAECGQVCFAEPGGPTQCRPRQCIAGSDPIPRWTDHDQERLGVRQSEATMYRDFIEYIECKSG